MNFSALKQVKTQCLILVVLTTFAATPAFATSFNFQLHADTDLGESIYDTFTHVGTGGITVTATAHNLANTQDYFVYLDSNRAGMGVCKTPNAAGLLALNTPQSGGTNLCLDGVDDNITNDEVLKLVFSEEVEIGTLTIVNGNHTPDFQGNFGYLAGPDSLATPTTVANFIQAGLVPSFMNPGALTGTTFYFISGATISGTEIDLTQMYISAVSATGTAPVPEPATLALFGTGLLGLGAM